MVQTLVPASEIHIATHPTRVKIAKELSIESRLTTSQLSKKLSLPEELIDFHLAILEKHELVRSEPDMGNPAAEIRVDTYFSLAPKFRRLLKAAQKLV